MRLFVLEAAHRAAEMASEEGDAQVDAHHLEKILPQLVISHLESHISSWIFEDVLL